MKQRPHALAVLSKASSIKIFELCLLINSRKLKIPPTVMCKNVFDSQLLFLVIVELKEEPLFGFFPD
jgi:hypothetical protein